VSASGRTGEAMSATAPTGEGMNTIVLTGESAERPAAKV
jgi:hypothetical protein